MLRLLSYAIKNQLKAPKAFLTFGFHAGKESIIESKAWTYLDSGQLRVLCGLRHHGPGGDLLQEGRGNIRRLLRAAFRW